MFLIGDAAGFAKPITAEGISNAILSGKYVAEAIIESALNTEIAAQLYNEKLHVKLLPELNSGIILSKYFYNNNAVRNILLKKFGQKFSGILVDVLHGDRSFPINISKKLKRKIKEMLFFFV